MVRKLDESLSSLGRFSEPAFNILVALADGPKHGCAMTQDIEQMSGTRPRARRARKALDQRIRERDAVRVRLN